MKIGLALGGGGVLGVAHVALLEELEKAGIKISAIAGTSAGAIVGGLYAAGGVEKAQQFFKLVDDKQILTRKSFILAGKPDNIFVKLEDILKELIVEDDFSKLGTPLTVVATDIDKAKMVKITHGSVIRAVMASSAYPGVFPFQEIDGKRLVDGGVANNLPVVVAKKDMNCNFVIASSLNRVDVLSSKKTLTRAAIVARALDILTLELEKAQLIQADFCFLPPVEEYRWYQYEKLDEILYKSQIYAHSIVSDLKQEIARKTPKGFFARLFSG